MPRGSQRMPSIMPKTDIKAMIKDLKKNELRELISVAQEVLSSLFNSSEIRDNFKLMKLFYYWKVN